MGFMTVVTVLNDAVYEISGDEEFGANLAMAIVKYSRDGRYWDRIVPAGDRCNAAEVISRGHADCPQYVVAHRNTGWAITSDPDDGVPDDLIKCLERILRERRQRKKKGVRQEAVQS